MGNFAEDFIDVLTDSINNVKNVEYVPEFEITSRGHWKSTGKKQILVELFDGSKWALDRKISEDSVKSRLSKSTNLGKTIVEMIDEGVLSSNEEGICFLKKDITLDIFKDFMKIDKLDIEPDRKFVINYEGEEIKAKVIGNNHKEDYAIMKFIYNNEVTINRIPYSDIIIQGWEDSEYEKKL